MTPPEILPGLSPLAGRYDVLLCDVWGVIHNGREAFGPACDALARWRAGGGQVILITNSPRPSAGVADQLDSLKVPRSAWSSIITSGDATRALLAARAPGPVWAVGPERTGPLYEGLGLTFTDPEHAVFISVTGPEDDEVEGPEDYRQRFEPLARRGLEMVCANPDIVVQRGDRLIYCGGALAQLYVELGGIVHMAGKPHAPIYDLCLAEAARLTGRLDRSRVLCIGDGLATDGRGAEAQGLDLLFITSGIHGAEAGGAAGAAGLLAQAGLSAAYAMADLVW